MSAQPTASLSPLEKHDFLLRRLHSLSGVLPIGLFLISHLVTNSSIVWGLLDARAREHAGAGGHGGAATFQHEVNFIHSIPFLFLIEVFGLWLPIAFHSIYGFYIVKTGKSNITRYTYGANWRYWLQRVSGYVGFLFIFYHIATLRWGWTFLIPGGTTWSGEYAGSTLAAILQGAEINGALSGTGAGLHLGGLLVSLFYMLGVSLLVFHFANGLWTWAITWGITISKAAQMRWGFVCFGLGAALMAMAWAAVIGFMTLDVKAARHSERALRGETPAAVEHGVKTDSGGR